MMQSADAVHGSLPSRRDLIRLGAGAFVVLALPAFLRRRETLIRRSVPAMGTIAEVGVVHRDPRYAHAAIDTALRELLRVERTMTRFSATSDVGRANRGAASGPVVITQATAAVVSEALLWAGASDGAFDPCIGKAVALWAVGSRRAPPPADAVRRLAGRALYRAVELDRWRGAPVVGLGDPDAALDLGGIAKGYGVDRAVQSLREWGIRRGLVNVGGDLFALGESERGTPWRVGVRSPRNPRRLATTIEVSDAAVATSGDYFQFFEHGGRRYHHLLDPETGAPRVSAVHSVTVVAADCMTADAAATTIFGLRDDRAVRLLRARAPGARVVSRG